VATGTRPDSPKTLLEAVHASLKQASRYHHSDEVAPVAVLWTDADGQWQPVVDQLRELCPELLTLGDYDEATRTGPAVWLRCVIEPPVRAAKFPGLVWPQDAVPVIYMPRVSRQTLRAVEECPDSLKPLVELQYRGAAWTQKNGRDWTLRAFFMNDETGLGLDVAEDRLTQQAMEGALSQLAVTAVEHLRTKRLEAEDFDRLLIGDAPRDLLQWLSDPEKTRARWDDGAWAAFRNRCRQDYGFDPQSDGEVAGGEKLGCREAAWVGVWQRFVESPALYPGIPGLLRRAKPSGELPFVKEPWPDENESMEASLRTALLGMSPLKAADGRERLTRLDAEHGPRRAWVWAKLDMCPLSKALEHLAPLARRTATPLGGDSAEAIGRLYAESGYLADDAALRALSSVKSAEDVAAVKAAIRCIYLPWLEDCARHLQECVARNPLPEITRQELMTAREGECLVFVDGLRFDVAQRLSATASERQLEASVKWRWAALPSVTATAKPAVSPIRDQLRGARLDADFGLDVEESGARLNIDRFRALLSAAGVQVLSRTETGTPFAGGARAWTEFGEFDKYGHDLQAGLAGQISSQVDLLVERVQGLLSAGWKRVRVVTDHGWLLVPGGMPKVPLPAYLAESRWSRCASIKDEAHVAVPVAGWSWNPSERFAHAPGVHCFVAGQEYAHGGISLQECLIPVVDLSPPEAPPSADVRIEEVRWVGLRCRVRVIPVTPGLVADLRTKANDPATSITTPKMVDSEGRTALLVPDETLAGTTVSLVVLNAAGRAICKQPTAVGGDD
jgi:hypothetical protein